MDVLPCTRVGCGAETDRAQSQVFVKPKIAFAANGFGVHGNAQHPDERSNTRLAIGWQHICPNCGELIMKWFPRTLIVLLITIFGLVGLAAYTAVGTERPVGFQIAQATDARGKPFALGIWYPTQQRPLPTTLIGTLLMDVAKDAAVSGQRLPLVVISHGNGGGITSHVDLALALANAGFVVAAPMHNGDNYADQSAVGSASLFNNRARQIRTTVDYMLDKWSNHNRIDPERVGEFGFSAGGFTVLTEMGAKPNLHLIATHCVEAPEFVCDVLRQAKSPLLNPITADFGVPFSPDERIKAAVVAAPGLGFTLVPDGLASVHRPVQLWSGELDSRVPYATNTKFVREALGPLVEFHSVSNAEHLSFLAPCGLLRPPGLCTDPEQFDRKSFHARMNKAVVAFFEKTLRPK